MHASRTVRQLLQEKGFEVWSIHPDATVFQALERMAEKDVGSLVVIEDARVVGIFSERDYARKVILHGHASRELAVRAIMSTNLITVTPDSTLNDCMRLMTNHRIRHLPVIENGRDAGLVSIGDVVKAVMAEQEFLIEQLQSYIQGPSY